MSAPSPRSWLRSFLKPILPVFREVLAMSFFVNALALAVPVFTKQVYDRVVFHAGISTLEGLMLGMLFVLVFDYVLRQSRSRIMQRVALRVDVVVGRALFEKFMSLPMKTLESQPGAHWQSLFRDVDVVRNTLSGASAVLMADLPFALLFFGIIFVIAPAIAWIILLMVPVFVFVAWRSGAVMAKANREERQTSQTRDSLVAEMIAGRTTIKALALDGAIRPIWEQRHAENIERAIVRGGKADSYTNLGASLTMLTTIFLTAVGAIAIIDQRLTIGGLIATNMLSGRMIGPVNQLVHQWRTYSGFKQAVERLGALFESPSERTESEVKLDKPNGEIEVEAVSFKYAEDSAAVVDNVSIKIEQGGVNALVGRNGSGKTTLLKLIQGLYTPSSGRVLLDGADISQFTRSELARWMGYVPQESLLFAGTVRDNIAHRIPDASDQEVVRAAKAAGIHQFIIDQPDGYATEIGEAGQRLSGGQRQRIAIARALVGEPPVLMLDEPSSSLDRQAEHDLRKTLEAIGETCTVIIVTHSPILLAACRDLIALDRGRVALAGPANEILPRLFGAGVRPTAASQAAQAAKKDDSEGAEAKPATSRPAAKAKDSGEPGDSSKPMAKPVIEKIAKPQVETVLRPVPLKMAEAPKAAPKKKPIEASPLLQSITAPKSESEREARPVPAKQEAGASQKSADAPDRPAKPMVAPRPANEEPAEKPKTKPVLRVAPAARPTGPKAADEGREAEDDARSAPPPVRHRPFLTVTQGGKATGTNGLAPPPESGDGDSDE